jgi:hypothetical protein
MSREPRHVRTAANAAVSDTLSNVHYINPKEVTA